MNTIGHYSIYVGREGNIMTKYLVTYTKQKIIFRKIKKESRPLTLVYDDLYRIDDEIAYRNHDTGDVIVVYPKGSQQPWGDGSYLDPEFTKVMIDSMKLSKGKINKLFDFNFDTIAIVIVAAIAVWAIASQLLGGM